MKLSWEIFRNIGLSMVDRNQHNYQQNVFPAVRNHNMTQTSERDFRAMFGVSWFICADTWNLIEDHGLYQLTRKAEHLLWALIFLKVYSNEKAHCTITGTMPKTLQKWVWQVLEEIALLEAYTVRIILFILYLIYYLLFMINHNRPHCLFFVYYTDTMGEQEVQRHPK